ncbi:MAG: hypothetical protein ACTHM1_05095 [Solirubrobacteraceae bacterium]
MRLSRTTGAGAGLLVLVLGLWAGFSPFVGPYFHYGFSPDATWHFTIDRLWLNVLPAVAAVLGGLMMIGAVRRASGVFGSWLALVGGVWLLLGPSVSLFWGHTAPGVLQSGIGTPLGGHYRTAAEMIGVFYGVGALITMIASFALGRFALAAPVAAGAPAGTAVAGTAAAADRGAPEEAAPRRRGLIRRRRGGASAERERGEGVSRY